MRVSVAAALASDRKLHRATVWHLGGQWILLPIDHAHHVVVIRIDTAILEDVVDVGLGVMLP